MYFVAFDIDAERFAFLRDVRGEVVGARNGDALRARLDEIYRGKILSEAVDAGETHPAAADSAARDSAHASHDSETMIMGKFFRAMRAQLNKIANIFFEADPIAVMQLEVDQATERLKEGTEGTRAVSRARGDRRASGRGWQVEHRPARGADQSAPQGRES